MTISDGATLEATLFATAALGEPDARLRALRDELVELRLDLQETLARAQWVTTAALRLRLLADLVQRGLALTLRTWALQENLAGRRFDLLEPYLPLSQRLDARPSSGVT